MGRQVWPGRASFDWILLYLDMRLRIIVREWLRNGLSGGVFFFCPKTSAQSSRPITGQAERARPGVMHAPFRLTERVQERRPEEVRTLVSGDGGVAVIGRLVERFSLSKGQTSKPRSQATFGQTPLPKVTGYGAI